MVNRRLNGCFGPSRRMHKPSKMKSSSKIMKQCRKEVKITRQHYMDGPQDKSKARKMPHIPSKKPTNGRGPWPNNPKQHFSFSSLKKTESRASSLGINNGVTTLAQNKPRALPCTNNDFSRSNEDSPSFPKKMMSKASLGLNNGIPTLAQNSLKSRFPPCPNNNSLRSYEDSSSLAKKMKDKASSGLNNGALFVAKNTEESWDHRSLINGSLRHKKIETSVPSSSKPNNGAMSLAKYIKMSKVSLLQNNGVMSAMKNVEKSRPSSSSPKNGVICSANNTEKSRSSLPSDGLPFEKLANPTYVGSKDDYSSTLRVSNNSCPKNLDVKDQCNKLDSMANVLVDNNQGKKIDSSKDGSVLSKFLTKKVSTSKDETTPDKNKYIRVDLNPVDGATGGQVRKDGPYKARDATNFSLALKSTQVIQNGQHIVGDNSSPIRKDLSSHQFIKESLKDFIDLDSKNQNTILEDDDITNDATLKRKRGELLVEKPETHEDYGKEVVHRGPAKKRRTFIDNYEADEGDDQSVADVRGVAAVVTTPTATVCTEGSKSFVSESAKLQYYSLLPIDEPIWSGIFKIGSNEYVSMAAHLSPKSCEKVWEVSRTLKSVVKVTKLSRLEAFPKGSAVLKPTHDNITLYFLPHEMRPNEAMDQLVEELIENNMVLRAVVEEAEMLILPSILLPEKHKTFKSKHYLWGVFRPRGDNVAAVDKHSGSGCCARDEEMGKQGASDQHEVEEGSKVAGLNMDSEIQAPEPVERQQMEKEPSPALTESNAPNPAEVAGFTSAAAMSANHVQSSSSLGVPSGAVFAFVAGETPRLKELIQELKRDGAVVVFFFDGTVVVAMQGAMMSEEDKVFGHSS